MRISLILLSFILAGLLLACNRSQPEPNRPPVAVADSYRLEQGASLRIGPGEGVLANDRDPDGDTLQALLEDAPELGVLTLNENGSFTYRHDGSRSTIDTFSYRVTDAEATSEPVSVTFNIDLDAINNPPVAEDQQVSVEPDTPRDFTLVANDVDGDNLSYTISQEPGNGTWSGRVPELRYTPEAGFSGTDTLEFYVSDGKDQSNTATITFNVGGDSNTPPVAQSASVDVVTGTPRDIELTGSDADGNPLNFFIETEPEHGILTGEAPFLTYEANSGYLGEDRFSFYVSDGMDNSTPATVLITVVGENNPPTDVSLDNTTLEENKEPGTVIGTLSTTDEDAGDSHRYVLADGEGGEDNSLFAISGDSLISAAVLDYEVQASYNIRIEVIDTKGDSFARAFEIALQDVNEVPLLEPQSFRVGESAANGTEVGSVFAFDQDAGQALSYSITRGNTGDAFQIGAASGILSVNNSAALSGSEAFELNIRVEDDAAEPLSSSAVITIEVRAAGAPQALDDSYDAIGNVPISLPAPGLLANDSDPEGAELSVVDFESSSASGGEVSVDADGAFRYNPPAGFQGSDSFSYTLSNGLEQVSARVDITVNDLIWFIDNTASAGDGRQASPFNTLSDFNAINDSAQANTTIFIYEGSGVYGGGLRLQDGQLLIGEGATNSIVTLTGLSLPPGSDLPATRGRSAQPRLSSTLDGIRLSDRNVLAGVSVEDSGRAAVVGSGITDLTLLDVSLHDCGDGDSNPQPSDECIELVNISGNVLLRNVDIARPAGRGVLIQNTLGELALVIEESSISENTNGDVDGLEVVLASSAEAVINISDSAFINTQTNGLQVIASGTAQASLTLNAVTVSKTAAPLSGLAYYGIDIQARGASFISFDFDDNALIRNDFDNAIRVVGFDQATVEGFIRNNGEIRSNSVDRAASSIYGFVDGDAQMRLELSNNSITNLNTTPSATSVLNAGIFLASRYRPAGGSGGRLDALIDNNKVSVASDYDIELLASDANVLCAAVRDNAASAAGIAAFRARQLGASELYFEGYSSSISTTWNSQGNTPTGSVVSSGSAAAASCNLP